MKQRWAPYDKQRGFTLVELLIVIVVIGILAALIIVAYNGVQHKAAESTVKSDLANAARQMGIVHIDNDAYPDVLPTTVKTSPGVKLELIKRLGGYSGLTNVQNGVLFQTICQQLISEGYGTGTNMGGGVEQYVTGCNVYNKNAMQINGWNAHDFSTPVSAGTVSGWVNSNVSSDAWRPNKKTVVMAFATELDTRFQALGGVFPVSLFWDSWATSTNGGVQYQALGTPAAPSDPSNFCVEGTNLTYSDIKLHVTQDGIPQTGVCP